MSKGRHAKPTETTSTIKKVALAATVGLGAAAVPATFAGTASAATTTVWDRLAECESSGNFATNTGNGYYGGFQFSLPTWQSVGGTGLPSDASPAEQLRLAKVLLAAEGPGQWACSPQAGLTKANGAAEGLSILGSSTPAESQNPSSTNGVAPSAAKAIAWALNTVENEHLTYVWGGEGPTGYDCSGYLQAAWRAAGVEIPRDTYGMDAGLPHVSQSDMRPGDLILLYFPSATGPAPNHVVMYIGDGKIVEMSGSRGNVVDTLEGRGGQITGVVRPAASESPTSTPTTPPPATNDDDTDTPAPPAPKPPKKDRGDKDHRRGHDGKKWGHDRRGGHGHHDRNADGWTGSYTVKSGDWLSKIARAIDLDGGWPELFKHNRDKVQDPDLIYPGQVLRVPAKGETPAPDPAPADPAPETPAPEPTEETPAPTTEDPGPGASGWMSPVDAPIGTPYHQSGSMWSLGYHTGVDFLASTGAPVHAAAGGTVVVAADNAGSYGTHVIIKHEDGLYTLYAHLSSRAMTVGMTVNAGDSVGAVGATGNVTGPHLHFEVRTSPEFGSDIDPIAFLTSHGVNF